MAIRVRRAYEEPGPEDGHRILVDRLWPRGIKKQDLRLDRWLKELAPSNELRRWFGHDPSRWEEFQRRYREELQAPEKQRLLDELADEARHGNVTLIYSAREGRHNNAVLLRDIIAERTGQRHVA